MYEPGYYRQQAERARRLSRGITDHEVSRLLGVMARDFEEIADDLERGAIEVRHPELMPQVRNMKDAR